MAEQKGDFKDEPPQEPAALPGQPVAPAAGQQQAAAAPNPEAKVFENPLVLKLRKDFRPESTDPNSLRNALHDFGVQLKIKTGFVIEFSQDGYITVYFGPGAGDETKQRSLFDKYWKTVGGRVFNDIGQTFVSDGLAYVTALRVGRREIPLSELIIKHRPYFVLLCAKLLHKIQRSNGTKQVWEKNPVLQEERSTMIAIECYFKRVE